MLVIDNFIKMANKKIKISPKGKEQPPIPEPDINASKSKIKIRAGKKSIPPTPPKTSSKPEAVKKKTPPSKSTKAPASNPSSLFKKIVTTLLIIGGIGVLAFYLLSPAEEEIPVAEPDEKETVLVDDNPIGDDLKAPANFKYQLDFNSYKVSPPKIIGSNQSLKDAFLKLNIPIQSLNEFINKDRMLLLDKNLPTVAQYFVLRSKLNDKIIRHIVYEPNDYEYYIFNFNPVSIEKVERNVEVERKTAAMVIKENLYKTVTVEARLPYELIGAMENILAWSVDFHHVGRGDYFKIIYDEKYVNGKPIGIGDIYAVYFESQGEPHYGFQHRQEKQVIYLNENGAPMKKAFLKSPVRYATISSPYNLDRLHPVLKVVKPHLGTDYAAIEGTPILAVATGEVLEARHKQNNGNYVKIKHDKTYTSQYLHMQGFAAGIQPGTKVQQGQVIGYVGQTGLATGPHVCFRFWKNGKQIDFTKERLPSNRALPKEELVDFRGRKDELLKELEGLQYF